MVLKVKLVSLKHKIPSDVSVVLETYKENPRNLDVQPLDGPVYVNSKTEIVYEMKNLIIQESNIPLVWYGTKVKLESLKHNIAFDLFVVLEM